MAKIIQAAGRFGKPLQNVSGQDGQPPLATSAVAHLVVITLNSIAPTGCGGFNKTTAFVLIKRISLDHDGLPASVLVVELPTPVRLGFDERLMAPFLRHGWEPFPHAVWCQPPHPWNFNHPRDSFSRLMAERSAEGAQDLRERRVVLARKPGTWTYRFIESQ